MTPMYLLLVLAINYHLVYCGDDPPQEDFLPVKPVPPNDSRPARSTIKEKLSKSTTESVSPKIEKKIVLRENTYNVYSRPSLHPSSFNNLLANTTESSWSNVNPYSGGAYSAIYSNQRAKECYKSLKEWKTDQQIRINNIVNQISKKNGSSIIYDWRIQKPLKPFYPNLWSILPDGVQLYLLRQKELTILNVMPEVRKESCCYANAYYDCAYSSRNATLYYNNFG